MASPWITPQRPAVERPWLGMAVMAAIPLLSLILIRMLWSGSSLWFLTVGIILLGVAAVIFLARRPQEHEYSRQALAHEANRLPLILTGLGVLFMAMLLLPNFSGGDSNSGLADQQLSSGAGVSDVSGVSQSPAQGVPTQQAPLVEQSGAPAEESASGEGQTYTVQSGDILWDIAQSFGTTVEAIAEANHLENPADIAIGQVLIIPPAGDEDGDEAPSEGVP
jgi:LysM repeat protein